jgi:hypothetical protein
MVIVASSLLLCKIQLVTLVLVLSFLKIDVNQIVSMFMDMYRLKVRRNVICLKIFSLFYDVLVLNVFLICPTALSGS